MAGRPKRINKEILLKLEEGFLKGLTDTEACLYSDIAPSTLYEYQKENPEFTERKDQLKQAVRMRAKLNITESINEGDKILSQWYLERKAKDEFSTRTEHTGADGKDLIPSKEDRELAEKALGDIQ